MQTQKLTCFLMTCRDKCPLSAILFSFGKEGALCVQAGLEVNENRRLERSEWVFCTVILAWGCFFGCGNIKH